MASGKHYPNIQQATEAILRDFGYTYGDAVYGVKKPAQDAAAHIVPQAPPASGGSLDDTMKKTARIPAGKKTYLPTPPPKTTKEMKKMLEQKHTQGPPQPVSGNPRSMAAALRPAAAGAPSTLPKPAGGIHANTASLVAPRGAAATALADVKTKADLDRKAAASVDGPPLSAETHQIKISAVWSMPADEATKASVRAAAAKHNASTTPELLGHVTVQYDQPGQIVLTMERLLSKKKALGVKTTRIALPAAQVFAALDKVTNVSRAKGAKPGRFRFEDTSVTAAMLAEKNFPRELSHEMSVLLNTLEDMISAAVVGSIYANTAPYAIAMAVQV